MIPRFFRCGDPTKKCPLAVTREIIKDQPGFTCPCKNEACSLHREDVGLLDGLTNGRSKLVYAGFAFLAFVVLLTLTFGGGNPAEKALAELKARLAPLESQLQQLEFKSKNVGAPEPLAIDPKPLQATTSLLQRQADDAIGSKDPMQVAAVHKGIEGQLVGVRAALESLDRPKEGSGVIAADAKSLMTKLVLLEDEAELQLGPIIANFPQSSEACEEFLAEVSNSQARARRLASPPAPLGVNPDSSAIRQSLGQLVARLETAQKKLGQFAPPPPPPFQPNQADLVVAASGNLAGDLVAPLAAAWSGGEGIPAEDGNIYITGNNGRRILVKPVPGSTGLKMLADSECAVFFADRPPSTAELEAFGGDFRESRSVAEVVALDALTLLVHPENPASSITVGSGIPFRIAAGPENSMIREKAVQFGIPVTGATEASGEDAALADRNLLSLGLYHEEGDNLRAKRLEVRATEDTRGFRPSPFTIATEDYLYSFRIVAWTAPNAGEEALQLVKFTTSNEGQELVAKQGFVDLRLAGIQEDVPPEILAALGAAIGSGTTSSATRLSTNFRFEVGRSELDLKAQADLERLPRYLFAKYPSYTLVILGFTDSTGPSHLHKQLSEERAAVVASQLKSSKVDARSAGLGMSFPVDTNATEAGRAKNRRAEVWAVRP